MNDSWIMRYAVAFVVVVLVWLLVELWFQPGERVRLTVRYIAGAMIVIVAIRVFVWFVGWG